MTKLYIVKTRHDYYVSRDFNVTMLEEVDPGYWTVPYDIRDDCEKVWGFCEDDFELITGIKLGQFEYCELDIPEFE